MPDELVYPITVDTVGKLIAIGMTASGHCNTCGRFTDLDLERIAARVGRDWRALADQMRSLWRTA